MIPPHLLERIPLLADGAPGDALLMQHKQAATSVGGLPEAFTLRRPEWVQGIHDAFFQAGARVLRTNTAQANAVSLAALELQERCEAVNNSAMALLRAAVGQQALVMGTVGEIAPSVPLPDRERAYAQQLVYLCDTGTDFVLLDGFASLEECLRVLRLARRAGDAPTLGVLRCDARGITPEAEPLLDGVQRLLDAECDAVGLCLDAPTTEPRALIEPVLALEAPTAVFLDGGSPGALSPNTYAARLAPLADLRVVILGGGRHIGPAHVAALAKALPPPKEHP
ncbi:MAG TPA: homocysteine S-methyltransferase family protein [bacterium]